MDNIKYKRLLTKDNNLQDKAGLSLLAEETTSLKNCLKIGGEMKLSAQLAHEELDDQEKILKGSSSKIDTILSNINVNKQNSQNSICSETPFKHKIPPV